MFYRAGKKILEGTVKPEFILLTEAEERMLCTVLEKEARRMAELYDELFQCASRIMKQHAPKQMEAEAERIVYQTLLFRTIGLFGGCAVQSGELAVPEFEGPAAVCVRENSKAAEATVNESKCLTAK